MKKIEGDSSPDSIDIDWLSYLKNVYPNIAKVYLKPSDMVEVNKKLTTRSNSLLLLGYSDLLDEAVTYHTTFYDLFIRVIHKDIGTER